MLQQPSNQLLTLPGLSGGNEPADAGPAPLPWWRRRNIIIGVTIALLAIIIIAVLLPLLNLKPPVTYQYQRITQGDLLLTVNATGPLQSSVYNLIFQGSGGKIDEIDIKRGQRVTKGQILAKLNKTSLEDAVNADQASLTSAQLSLDSALANARAAQKNVNANVGAAQTSVAVSQANQGATQSVSDANVATAQTTLNNARSNLERVRTETNTQINQAEAQRQQDRQSCNNQSTSTTSSSTPTATGSITPTTITTSSSSSTSSTSKETCYQLADDKYNSTVAIAKANLTTAESTVNTSEQSLTQAKANANSSNTTAQGQVTTNQSSVDTSKASTGTTSAESSVASAQGNLAVAVANLQTAQHNLNNAALIAPHDGIVTTINGTVGGSPGVPVNSSSSTSNSSTSTFIQIVDVSALQVQASVNESDTANLKVGQPARFTVSAYGDQQFKGTVSVIAPNGVKSSNVIIYPVNIDFDQNSAKDANLFPNMTANVTITVVQRRNMPQVPVNVINFARQASNTTGGTPPVSKSEANSALQQARQMLVDLENQNPTVQHKRIQFQHM